MAQQKNKILLAFSGGLDTSALIPWLKETYNAEVTAYCSDLGNSPNGEALKKWAHQLGAVHFIFEDLKEDFAKRFAFAAVRAGATYQDDYLLGTSLGRPLIAERMAYHAQQLGITALSHGCTGKGNDQLRFERSWAYLVPDLEIIAPWRIWNFKGRSDLLAYLKEKGFDLPAKEKVFSEDVNLFHRSCEGGILEDPGQDFDPKQIYHWVKPLSEISADSMTVEIGFTNGFPTSINNKNLSSATLLSHLNQIAGEAGIGVQDLVEERANGIKSRGIYETPGGTLLHAAVRALKHLCWDRTLLSTARTLGQQYGECVYDGFWHTDLRQCLEAFFEKASKTLTGSVTFKLEKGQMRFVSRKSPFSLYDMDSVTFEADQGGIHHLAEGYCKIIALKQRQAGLRDRLNHKPMEF
ncbi:MAG: argininosuccinate synthase [Bdellovibrionales bacterium]|nr:argininosuccinate synthase [Bdellovibrionales bacterium]